MPEVEELWSALSKISVKLHDDADFEAAFNKDPASALVSAGLDAEVPATEISETVKLSSLLGKMSDIERRATLEAVTGSRFDPGRVAAVTPIANANAGANANALANANANANANTNTNGFSGAGIRGDLIRVELGQSFRVSDIGTQLTKMRLSPARQSALVKSAFSDGNNVIKRTATANGELATAVVSFRGLVFEVEALLQAGEIAVQSAKAIR